MSAADRRADRTARPGAAATPVDAGVAAAALEATGEVARTGEIAGVVGEGQAGRSGEDVRRRGWFWHWNSIITQFAPLIGLKGVGLLNSYTVWTDRREESPHRGYAFPSQQSEADFYGEDRAELIAINKVLVALDLIEIRKEMVLRVDERGRRWRVPHNFYRVKDHADGFVLTRDKVLRVVELADRDAAVYRSVRHVFSARFAPIDADNPWHRILPELRQTDLWRRLAARVAAEEERAAARTRAGHAARSKRAAPVGPTADSGFFAPERGATPTTDQGENDSPGVVIENQSGTGVAMTNTGSGVDVAGTNNGSSGTEGIVVGGSNRGLPTVVPGLNSGRATDVAPANRTYDQENVTTTTRRSDTIDEDEPGDAGHPGWLTDVQPAGQPSEGIDDRPVTTPHEAGDGRATEARPVDEPGTAGPGGQPAPTDAPGELTAIRAFEDANARRATPAERQLLRGLAERFHPAAVVAEGGSGWAWVAAAIYEAVEAGSAFVAPRRAREILARWERDGGPETGRRADGQTGSDARSAAGFDKSGASGRIENLLGEGPDIPLPHGHGSRRTWAFAVGLLAAAVGPERLAELVAGTAIVGYRDGEVTLAAPDPVQAERLATAYRELVERKLSEAMRRPVRLAVLTADGETERRADGQTGRREGGQDETTSRLPVSPVCPSPEVPVFLVPECGLPSPQVWAAVLEEVLARGDIGRANFDAWLRTTELIGRDEDGAFVVGAPHALAQRRIASRFLPPLRAAVAAVTGERLPVEVVVAGEWLRENRGGGELSAAAERRAGA